MTEALIQEVRKIMEKSPSIAFFGGAGVSTASGIPDFRSATGLYNQKSETSYSPEYMLSHDFLIDHPGDFSDYVRNNLINDEAKPNGAHRALKTLEDRGQLTAVITQNIDGLHQLAGSSKVLEIHGNLTDYYCRACGKPADRKAFLETTGAFHCDCGGVIRPDVVLYGEGLDERVWKEAAESIAKSQTLIVGGTSLMVYPAASLLSYYRGKELILINQEATGADRHADYVLQGDISKILPALVD
mgnify:CR=1 FL=1